MCDKHDGKFNGLSRRYENSKGVQHMPQNSELTLLFSLLNPSVRCFREGTLLDKGLTRGF